MALGTDEVSKAAASTAKFVPQIWQDEVIATFKKATVMMPMVTKFSMVGKRGDTLNVPAFTRGTANSKTVGNEVTLEDVSGTGVAISINKWYEKSYQMDDLISYQTTASLRRTLTENAGYALALQVDTDLIQLGRSANGGNGDSTYTDNGYIGSDGATLHNGTNEAALADAGIRRTIQRLDDADVPMDQRYFVIPPVAKSSVLALDKFTIWNSLGNSSPLPVKTGTIGDLYGVEVAVSSNCDTAGTGERICLMFHKSWAALAIQKDVRVQTGYHLPRLADIIVADTVYGVAELRDNACVPLVVPA